MKIAMITEGTYPHGFGGVSVWCDQLVRGMPEHEFSLVAIAASAADEVVWSLPGNVTSLSTIALWGSAGRRPRGQRRGLPSRIAGDLISTLLDPSDSAQDGFAEVLRELFELGQSGTGGVTLASEKTVRVLCQAWGDRWPAGGRGRPSTHDAVTALQLLDHFLRPLWHPPAEADVVHTVANGLGILPALAAKWRHGIPVMVTEHGVYLRELYLQNRDGPYRWPVKALYLAFMRRLCTLGYHTATTITPGNVYNRRWEELLGADPARIRTVYNGVDPAHFPAVEGEPEAPTISWLGRVDPIKDLETLLRAFALVWREMPAARLRIFGSAPKGREPYLARCRALAADLGIDGPATFEGRVDNVRDAYEAGSIVVLSSVSEGFPYSLIEAMTCGRPCVATNVGGVTEAVGDTGLVVPPRSPEPMAEACLALLRDPGLRHRLGAAARNRALENFTLDAAISTFDEIYSFLGRGRPLPVAGARPGVHAGYSVAPTASPGAAAEARSQPNGSRPAEVIS
jgi:glycosyltransferase involved in cell wall biosynthesis